jgi:hypothetical protein
MNSILLPIIKIKLAEVPLVAFSMLLAMIILSLGRNMQWTENFYSDDCKCVRQDEMAPFVTRSPTPKEVVVNSEERYVGPQTTYLPWPEDRPFPCFEAEKNWKHISVTRSPTKEGFLYTRETKTGSSTMTGVLLRIAYRKAREMLGNADRPCKNRIDHSPARALEYGKRDREKSFLISMLREPTKRAISAYFHFRVSRQKEDPIDKNFQNYFRIWTDKRSNITIKDPFSNYYTMDLTVHDIDLENGNHTKIVQDILESYDFIAITERMDESLVVLKMLLHLQYNDILYMSAKKKGSFIPGPHVDGYGRCIYIVPGFLSPGMKEFFASEYWKSYVAVDNLLYKAAQKSLDNTIDALGRSEFEKQLATFRRLLEQAQTDCEGEPLSRCDDAGRLLPARKISCLYGDVGCEHKCLSRVNVGIEKQSRH